MSIKVGVSVRKRIFPEWVNDAMGILSAENKEQIIKCVIYILMKPVDDGIEIHELLAQTANRIPVLPSIKDAMAALMIGESLAAWHSSNQRADKIKYET